MRKNSIPGYFYTFMFKPAFQTAKHNLRLISIFITMIHSFVVARQHVFLKTLVSMHPHNNSSLPVINILKKGGIKNHAYNNSIINCSYTV